MKNLLKLLMVWRELEAVRDQVKQSQKERDKTLKDKESLLKEVRKEKHGEKK